MFHFNLLPLLFVFISLLLSGCGFYMEKTNLNALSNNALGTSKEEMQKQLIKPLTPGCEVVATIEIDNRNTLEACNYTISVDTNFLDDFVYFYKGKYAGYGDKRTFINNFIKKIEKEKNPLFVATENGDIDEVKMLLEKGANLNAPSSSSDTPLIKAIVLQNEKIVELLLDNGANPNMTNNLGYSPLHIAASKNSTEILNALLSHGAEIDQRATQAQGGTPLMLAVFNDRINIVKGLVANGANLNIVETTYGNTPFLQAAIKKQYEIAEFLVRNGADTEISDYQGITAQQLAINTNDNRLLEIIRFNPQLLTLENIESQYDEELKIYQKRKEEHLKEKEKYIEKESKFLNELSNEQLKRYSIYIDNINHDDNRAKILLSFREFSGNLDNKNKDEFVQLYSIKQGIDIHADLLEKMNQNLIERKNTIAELKEEIADAEKKTTADERQAIEAARNRQQTIAANQQAIAAQQAQNTVGMLSIVTMGLNTYNSIQTQKYNAQAEAYRQYSQRYESDRQNKQLVNSLYGIESAIRNSAR